MELEKTVSVVTSRSKKRKSFSENVQYQKDRENLIYKLKFKMFYYFISLSFFTIYQYFLVPISFLIELIFLANDVVDDSTYESVGSLSAFKTISWIILFVLPLWNFFYLGIEISLLCDTILLKMWTMLVILFETIIDVPFTFFLKNNMFSIFLYDEVEFNQSLNTWLVFFPTNYHMSWFQILRGFITNFYFVIIGGILYGKVKNNYYETFMVSLLIAIIVFNVFKLVGTISILIAKIINKGFSIENYEVEVKARIKDNKENRENYEQVEVLDEKEKKIN